MGAGPGSPPIRAASAAAASASICARASSDICWRYPFFRRAIIELTRRAQTCSSTRGARSEIGSASSLVVMPQLRLSFDERTVARLHIARRPDRDGDGRHHAHRWRTCRRDQRLSRLLPTDADGNLIGYLHLKDVLEHTNAPRTPAFWPSAADPAPARRIARSQALTLMQETGSHIAQVHDEDRAAPRGGVLEGIVQQLIGQLRAEPGARASITDATAPPAMNPVPASQLNRTSSTTRPSKDSRPASQLKYTARRGSISTPVQGADASLSARSRGSKLMLAARFKE